MTEVNDPAVARKRRKAIIQSQRSELEQLAETPALPVPSDINNEAATAKSTKRKAAAEDKGAKQPNGEAVPPSSKKIMAPKKLQASAESESPSEDDAKKKAQIRYDPDVPMSKEQLAAWRREARRVRNRESAAASRARIRSRITELEDEVGEWKSKYAQAMQRLQSLEKKKGSASKNGV